MEEIEKPKTLPAMTVSSVVFPASTTLTSVSTPTILVARQIWADPTTTSGRLPHSCTPYRLPSGGAINIGQGHIITLTQDAGFQPMCPGTPVPPPVDPLQPGVDLAVLDSQDPFYSSTNPQIYAIAAVTIVSYMLLIILFITPRTFFVGGVGGGGGVLSQRGMMSGSHDSNPVIGIGSRPWLQKIAALSVAVSLTLVTADTFKWAHRQYDAGYQDATELTDKVISGLEVRIVRTISETCLWLAQAQTLIRLFPRHKEKLMIKWIAFALIVLELIFSILNHFLVEDTSNRPKRFVNAIPAMNYLFALSLNLCYGGFIVYYALQKRRFAFYHPQMRNMPLVALLSLVAVAIPVVFFVLDLSKPNVSGWGSYVRWVGAAAASVVVWEWVERIEALERDENRNGILGREIFDGDEMLDATPASDLGWPSSHQKSDDHRPSGGYAGARSTGWINMKARARRLGSALQPRRQTSRTGSGPETHVAHRQEAPTIRGFRQKGHVRPTPPVPVASPVSREDTTSAASTVYMVRYHPLTNPTPPIREDTEPDTQGLDQQQQEFEQVNESSLPELEDVEINQGASKRRRLFEGLQRVPHPFKRQRETPPPEVVKALAQYGQEPSATQGESFHHAGILERLHLKKTPKVPEAPRPVIVVPAPPRRRSSAEGFDGCASDASLELSVDRDASTSTASSCTRNMDRPPDAVLDAIRNSCSTSPLSGRANATSDINEPGIPLSAPAQGSSGPRDAERSMNSPILSARFGSQVENEHAPQGRSVHGNSDAFDYG